VKAATRSKASASLPSETAHTKMITVAVTQKAMEGE
jgi:hypothetical protein